MEDALTPLRAERDLLETRLLILESAIEEQRLRWRGVPDATLVKREEHLLAKLRLINGELAKMHEPAVVR